MKNLIKHISETYPAIAKDIYLLDNSAKIAMIKGEDVVIVGKYVYNSSKGKYIRINTEGTKYVRVYLDQGEKHEKRSLFKRR